MLKNSFKSVAIILFITSLFSCSLDEDVPENLTVKSEKGKIQFYMDFNELNSSVNLDSRSGQEISISTVTITLSRDTYEDITSNLSVSENIASGYIDNLDSGYWHILANVYDQSGNVIYTGEVDVQVIAGFDVECHILFDPVIVEPTAGGINFTIGINPMPGYTILNQRADDVFMNDVDGNVYIFDATTHSIGVFSAATMIKERDIVLEQSPASLCLSYDKSAFLLGYSSGRIYSLNITTEVFEQVADVLMDVEKIITFSDTYALVCGPGSWDDEIKTVNLSTGQVIDTHNPYDHFGGFVYNEVSETIYTYDTGVSPSDIHYIKVDLSTGEIISENDTIYHGDYSYGAPLRIINGGTRVITSSGNMFTSTVSSDTDLRYAGSIDYAYADLVSDDVNGKIYMINKDTGYYYNDPVIRKFLVIDQETFFLTTSIDMLGDPQRIFHTQDQVIILSEYEEKIYSKIFNKADFLI